MGVWLFVLDLLQGDSRLAVMALAIALLTVVAAVLGVCLKSTGLYAACCLLFVCGGGLYFYFCGVEGGTLFFLLAVEGCWVGVFYALAYAVLELERLVERRRLGRKEEKRRLQFTLPDRDNSYLRSRLQTALCAGKEEACLEQRSNFAKLGYAKRMLANLKTAPLSAVERMDVEEMAGLLSAYDRKEKWTASDMKAISETFARLLKLAAKYDVAV